MPPGIRPRLSTKPSNELEVAPPKSTKLKKVLVVCAILAMVILAFVFLTNREKDDYVAPAKSPEISACAGSGHLIS